VTQLLTYLDAHPFWAGVAVFLLTQPVAFSCSLLLDAKRRAEATRAADHASEAGRNASIHQQGDGNSAVIDQSQHQQNISIAPVTVNQPAGDNQGMVLAIVGAIGAAALGTWGIARIGLIPIWLLTSVLAGVCAFALVRCWQLPASAPDARRLHVATAAAFAGTLALSFAAWGLRGTSYLNADFDQLSRRLDQASLSEVFKLDPHLRAFALALLTVTVLIAMIAVAWGVVAAACIARSSQLLTGYCPERTWLGSARIDLLTVGIMITLTAMLVWLSSDAGFGFLATLGQAPLGHEDGQWGR
jgi:hypothetical protein